MAMPALRSQTADVSLMPMPARLAHGEGQFVINGSFDVRFEGYKEPRLELARKRMLGTL